MIQPQAGQGRQVQRPAATLLCRAPRAGVMDMAQRIGPRIRHAVVEIAGGIRRTADAHRIHDDEKGPHQLIRSSTSGISAGAVSPSVMASNTA